MAYEPRGDHRDRGGDGGGQDGFMKVRGRRKSHFASLSCTSFFFRIHSSIRRTASLMFFSELSGINDLRAETTASPL